MQVINCQQGSQEWLDLRLGKITASMFSAVISKGATRKTYMVKLAAEKLTGISQDGFSNKAMEWGTEHEDMARANYELETFNDVNEVGFVQVNEWVGVSPDGLVGEDGLIEIKCPNSNTHIDTVLGGKMPTKHKPQVQGQLWATNRKWCDFVSFDPRMPSKQLFIVRVERDEEYIAMLKAEVEKFRSQLEDMVNHFQIKEAK